MNTNLELSIFEIVGSPVYVSAGDGEKVYVRLTSAFKAKRHVTLSFCNVTVLTPTFLNTAIGQLYGTYRENDIDDLLVVQDMQPDDLELLKRVVETAKLYFKDPVRFDLAVREAHGDYDDVV